jgi:hypothetical protein
MKTVFCRNSAAVLWVCCAIAVAVTGEGFNWLPASRRIQAASQIRLKAVAAQSSGNAISIIDAARLILNE